MKQSTGNRTRADYSKGHYFLPRVLVFLGLFYYASQKIKYNWRWNRTPIYFAYQDDIEVTSDIDGEVSSIRTEGNKCYHNGQRRG